MNKIDLDNKTAIITGGAQGFGFAMAKRFLESGANVIIWDIDKKSIEESLGSGTEMSSKVVQIIGARLN